MKKTSAQRPKFSAESIEFIVKASRQKDPEWLDKNRKNYEELLQNPIRALMELAAKELKEEARGYRFPLRGVARLKRSAERAKSHGIYRDWVSVSVSRDSGSRYDSLPNLYFHIDGEDVLSAGGLYTPSAKQTRHIRAWIDHDASKLDEIFADRNFKKIYPEFGNERVLKTKPRDYPLDHPRIEWLKLSAWYVWRPFTRKEFYSVDFADCLIEHWRQILRLNHILDYYTSTLPPKTGITAIPLVQRPELDWED